MSDFNATPAHGLEMGVQVKRARTGTIEAVVAEEQLERHGFGINVDMAVESYRSEMERMRLAAGDLGSPSWADTAIAVRSDEDSGYPTMAFALSLDVAVKTTRHHKALRMFGQYLIDVANGLVPDTSMFAGAGLQLEVTEVVD